MPRDTEKYPEHARIRAYQDQVRTIGSFLNWLTNERDRRVVLCYENPEDPAGGRRDDRYLVDTTCLDFNRLIAQHLGIDWDKVQAEKDAMYEELTEAAE